MDCLSEHSKLSIVCVDIFVSVRPFISNIFETISCLSLNAECKARLLKHFKIAALKAASSSFA